MGSGAATNSAAGWGWFTPGEKSCRRTDADLLFPMKSARHARTLKVCAEPEADWEVPKAPGSEIDE